MHLLAQPRLVCCLAIVVLSGSVRAQEVVLNDTVEDLRPQRLPPVDAPPDLPGDAMLTPAPPMFEVPEHARQWWVAATAQPMLRLDARQAVSLEDAKLAMLQHAPELAALRARLSASDWETQRQDARFDTNTFLDSVWRDDSTPVGSTLDGAAQRVLSNQLTTRAGVVKSNPLGGQLQAAQEFGVKDSNSTFFNPRHQGNARMTLAYEQPLLRGAGRMYNNAPTVLAALERDITGDQLQGLIQQQLLNMAGTYWKLVQTRGVCGILRQSLQRAVAVAEQIETRQHLDASRRQVLRAQAEVAARTAKATRAEYEVLRAQEQFLRSMLGAEYRGVQDQEWLPTSLLAYDLSTTPDIQEAVELGLRQRFEIHETLRRIESAALQQQVARKDLLPGVSLVMTTYVAGLRGNSNFPLAFQDQFSTGRPGYSAGFTFDLPWGNRAAKAAAFRQSFELARWQEELRTQMVNVTLDVREQIIAEWQANAEVLPQHQAVNLAREDLEILSTRLELLVDGSRVAELYLDDLLQSQARLEAAELALLQAQVAQELARAQRLYATGSLVSPTVAPPPEEVLPVEEVELETTDGVMNHPRS